MKPIPAYLVVRQTYFAIWARLLSERSASESVSAKLTRAPDGVMTLAAVYRNTPRMAERATSPMHLGAFMVEVRGDPVKSIAGHYWTDRETAGEMEFVARSNKAAAGFEEAGQLAFSEGDPQGPHLNGRRPLRRKASATKPASRM